MRFVYQLKFYGTALTRLLDDIEPHLLVKKQQASIVRKLIGTMTNGHRKLPIETVEAREALYVASRVLNTPGYAQEQK